MTAADIHSKTPPAPGKFRLPDPPEHPDDKMTSFKQLSATGHAHHLAMHLGNPDTTLVTGERYVVVRPTRSMAGSHYPDIDEQGKPPDFVLEIASQHTGHVDVGEKRVAYESLGIPEHWRFDETGQHHGARLAGDRLVEDRYEPIDIDELADGGLQGYSAVLNLHLRWENGRLAWYDPDAGRHIATFESERGRADDAETRASVERAARAEAETRADAAEARVQKLEAELRQLRGG